MICVLLLAAGEAWESPALADLEAHPGVVVLKRCVDVDDLLASVTSGQADVAVVSLDAPALDPSSIAHLRRHAVRPVLETVRAVFGRGLYREIIPPARKEVIAWQRK